MAVKYVHRPSAHKMYQPLQVPPKFTQIRIFGLKICHLATLDGSPMVRLWFVTDEEISTRNPYIIPRLLYLRVHTWYERRDEKIIENLNIRVSIPNKKVCLYVQECRNVCMYTKCKNVCGTAKTISVRFAHL
jgi:hypothetical protein